VDFFWLALGIALFLLSEINANRPGGEWLNRLSNGVETAVKKHHPLATKQVIALHRSHAEARA
jgi:hypothetical protein